MANISDQVSDLLLRHDIDLMRVDADIRNKVEGVLNGLSNKLRDRIARFEPSRNVPVLKNKKLNQLVYVATTDIERAYNAITKTVVGDLSDLAVAEGLTVTDTLNRAMRVDLASNQLHLAKLKAMAGNTMIEGAPIKEWWAKQTPALREAFQNEMREGILSGESIDDMIRRVRGTRANRFKDGLISGRATNAARRMVRSSVLAVANNARMETFKANSDVVKGVQWVSTLDERTSDICKVLDGQAWTLNGRKLPGTTQNWRGPPPAHWNCRSTISPVVKTFTDLARERGFKKKIKSLNKAGKTRFRAAADGKKAGTIKYERWLKKQPIKDQEKILGKTKFKLWKEGKIKFRELIDQNHRPLSVRELLEKVRKRSKIPPVIPPTPTTGGAPPPPPKIEPDQVETTAVSLSGDVIEAGELNSMISVGERTVNKITGIPDAVKNKAIFEGDAFRKYNSAYRERRAGTSVDAVNKLVTDVDNVAPSSTPDVTNLMQLTLKAEIGADAQVEKVTPYMEKLYKSLLSAKQTNEHKINFEYFKKDLKFIGKANATREVITNNIEDVYAMVNTKPVRLNNVLARGRGYANPFSRELNTGSNFSRQTTFHEYGHHVEFQSKVINDAMWQFVKKRRYGKTRYRLQKYFPGYGYRKTETAYAGDFLNPYIAKTYPKYWLDREQTTEVLSMGLQHFESPKMMAELFVKDNELFNLTLGAILK